MRGFGIDCPPGFTPDDQGCASTIAGGCPPGFFPSGAECLTLEQMVGGAAPAASKPVASSGPLRISASPTQHTASTGWVPWVIGGAAVFLVGAFIYAKKA